MRMSQRRSWVALVALVVAVGGAACSDDDADTRVESEAAEAEAQAEAEAAEAEEARALAEAQEIEDARQVDAYIQDFCGKVDAHIAAVQSAQAIPDPVDRLIALNDLYVPGAMLYSNSSTDLVMAGDIGDENMQELTACQDELVAINYG